MKRVYLNRNYEELHTCPKCGKWMKYKGSIPERRGKIRMKFYCLYCRIAYSKVW